MSGIRTTAISMHWSICSQQALKVIAQLSASDRNALVARLDKVRVISHNFGYGVGDDMDSLLTRFVKD